MPFNFLRRSKKSKVQDLEIKDPNLIFNSVWSEFISEVLEHKLRFPKEIFWLNGAPGAGKGTHTRFIMQYRDISADPIVMSDILQTPEAKRLKDAGLLVGDREVFSILLRKLMDPIYENGAIVDGFPRTKVQVECLKLFYNKLLEVRSNALKDSVRTTIRKPIFHIIVLFIDEAESIKRQLKRGLQAREHNLKLQEAGVGVPLEVRITDLDENAARNRYRTFKEVTYDSLRSLKEVFHYHYINAQGSIEEIQARIIEELKYQSSLELSQKTFDRLNKVPVAADIIKHARQQLVHRLDDYELHHTELFKKVVDIIETKFMPIITRHAFSGQAIVNTQDEIFSDPLALAILIDIFSERGYHAVIDLRQEEIPDSIDPSTNRISTRLKKVYRVHLHFKGSHIRRGF